GRLALIPVTDILLEVFEIPGYAEDEAGLLEAIGDAVRLVEPALEQESRPERHVRSPMTPQTRREGEERLLAIRDADGAEGRRQMRGADHLPGALALHGVGPLTDAGLFAGVDLLAFSDQRDERESIGRAIGDLHEQLRLRGGELAAVPLEHAVAVPRALGLVEDDDALRRHGAPRACVLLQERAHVLDELVRATAERVL